MRLLRSLSSDVIGKMKKLISKLILWFIIAVLFTAAGWFSKGAWDSVFYLHGRVHIVNTLSTKPDVSLTFPSGEIFELKFDKAHSKNIYVGNTGEGSISVVVDGEKIKCDSYVTSVNGLIVITITNEEAIFSQVFD